MEQRLEIDQPTTTGFRVATGARLHSDRAPPVGQLVKPLRQPQG